MSNTSESWGGSAFARFFSQRIMKREVKKRTPTHVVVFVCAKVHVINENVFPIGTRIVAMLSIRNFFTIYTTPWFVIFT